MIDLTGHIEKATETSPPCIFYFVRPCNTVVNQSLHPPHLYHCFHQLQALDGEWGFLAKKESWVSG